MSTSVKRAASAVAFYALLAHAISTFVLSRLWGGLSEVWYIIRRKHTGGNLIKRIARAIVFYAYFNCIVVGIALGMLKRKSR